MNTHTVFIGGGINNLVAASLLAKANKKVIVLEKSEYLGGCIRSEMHEGCVIDTLSTAYPLFVTSPAYAALKTDLENEGVEFVMNATPTATVLSNKKFSILHTDKQKNDQLFNALAEGDGVRFREQIQWVEQNAELLFTLLGNEIQTFQTAKFLGKTVWKKGIHNSLDLVGSFLPNVRNDFSNYFHSPQLQALLAPWVLHTGLSPESPFSSTMAKIIAFTVELVGLPLVKGGSYKIVEAFKNIIEKNGGECLINQEVSEILLDEKNEKAIGVKTIDNKKYLSENVVASTTPNQLYQKLIANKINIPETIKTQTQNFKYGMGNTQIHLILKNPPQWFDKSLANVVYTHLSDGIDAVSKAVNEAKRQILPENPTICIAQPSTIDTTRATDGKSVLWIQLPESPNYPKADATGQLNNICNGEWTEELKNAYADRVIDQISKYIFNIKEDCIFKKIISPKELSHLNINLEHGDPYGGACDLDQYLLWRPLKSLKNHSTPIKNLYHSGASTHPGPGLSGGSGYLIYQLLK